jgi:hypothetical protein
MQFKILLNDREYTDWQIYDAVSLQEINKESINIKIDPISEKLFSSDIFEIHDDKIKVLHSSLKCMPIIPGILILKGNKSFGKYKQKNLYKLIPDDRRMPSFLVPYQIKLGFDKNISNKYVVFKYDNWNQKHPQGTIVSVLGDVDQLDNFYEYQLYCKSLYASIQNFNKATTIALKKQTTDELINNMIFKNNLTDRCHLPIFSIDSSSTTDFDDAIGIQKIDATTKIISIYIANVSLWMNELDLWESFSQRISTIYLPDRKRPMLPTILSECLCSLCENEKRLAFTLDITITREDGKLKITNIHFENCYVKLYKNHHYESADLLKDNNYLTLFALVEELSFVYKYTHKVKNSYDFITYLMILMNYYTAKEMIKYNDGIFRSVKVGTHENVCLPEDINKFLTIWHGSCGQYDIFDNMKEHEMLKLESYIHFTSPIRRLVDLLNMTKLQINLKMVNFDEKSIKFYNNWLSQIEYINTTMRAIRKIQNDCSLLNWCNTNLEKEHIFEGYIFDKIIRNDGLYQYIVYLHEIKMVSRITSRHDLIDYNKYNFNIFMFEEEATLKKKIRLNLLL